MWIKSFWVEGYLRLKDSRIKRLDLDLNQPYNFILGGNGAGKSSLMEILNVLPIKSAMFGAAGGKGGVVEHNGHTYEFTSVRHGGSTKHTLTKDGEDICREAITAIYQHHIEYEFGYDKKRHDLLTQKIRFTEMRFTERQRTLTDISNIDMTYALGMHERLSKRHRELMNTVSYLTDRLRDLKNDRLALGEIGETERNVQLLTTRLRDIYRRLGDRPVDYTLDDVRDQFLKASSDIRQQINQVDIDQHIELLSKVPYGSPDELKQALTKLSETEHSISARRQALQEQLHEETKFLQRLDGGLDGVASLESELSEINEWLESRKWMAGQPDATLDAVKVIEQACASLVRLAQEKPDNYRPVMRPEYQRAYDTLEKQRHELRRYCQEADKLDGWITHYDHVHKESPNCNNCGTLVMPKGAPDADEYNRWKGKAASYRGQIDALMKAVSENETNLSAMHASLVWTERYLSLLGDNHWADWLMGTVCGPDSVEPASADAMMGLGGYVGSCDGLVASVREACRERDVRRRRKEIQQALEAHRDAAVRIRRSEALEKELESLSVRLQAVSRQRRDHQLALDVDDSFRRKANMALSGNGTNPLEELIEKTCRFELASELVTVQAALSEADNFMGRVRDIESNIAMTEKDLAKHIDLESVCGKLAKALSPKTGLIAEQMEGFLSEFIRQINKTISSIWTYPIVVNSPEIENGKMEYRFPVELLQSSTPDVTETSEGQQGIINLAFSLNMMKFQKDSKYPLYLDEIGREFDEQHRIRFRTYVRGLAAAGQEQQVFMISHDSIEYSESSGVNYIVLAGENITLPSRANELTEITYY